MSRRMFIAGNWKMNMNHKQAVELINMLRTPPFKTSSFKPVDSPELLPLPR